MIPILYDSTEVSFTSNGLGRLADCISCTVTEERNGIYECQFQYPITGEMYPLIQEGCILGIIHDDVKDIQPFDIYGRSAPLNGVVTFFAHHISYRLGNIILKPMSAPTCASALNEIPNNTYTECPFTFWTDKSVSATWKNEVPNPVKAILGGQQGSILDVYGKGEYEFDKWLVRLYVNRGVDNGVSIRYGVNLTDLRHDIDTSSAYTGVVPFWKSAEDDTVVTLTEGYVMVSVPQLVPLTENNGEEITDDQGRTIYLNAESSSTLLRTSVMDLSEAFEEQPTQEQLRAEALRRLTNSEAWLPSENIKVSFVDLAHTEEYKAVSALQRVRLCDWVSVYCGPLGVSAVSMQVIRVVFNVLNERYNEIELGKARASFADTVLQDVTETVSNTVEHVKSLTASAIDKVTKQITGANGGHIRFVYDANGDPQEILIMDTEDINTAVNVWRWNSGGLGFSSHGYAGPYSTAMTADGQIVADMIATGVLNANLIGAGMVRAQYLDGDNLHVKAANIDGILVIGQLPSNVAMDSDIPTKTSELTNDSGFQNATQVTTITETTIATTNVIAQYLQVQGANISGTLTANKIKGGTLSLGGYGNQLGTLQIINGSNSIIGIWDKDGINIRSGSIHTEYAYGGQNQYNYAIDLGDTTAYPLLISFQDGTLTSGTLRYGRAGLYVSYEDANIAGNTTIAGNHINLTGGERGTPQLSMATRAQTGGSAGTIGQQYFIEVTPKTLQYYKVLNSSRSTFIDVDASDSSVEITGVFKVTGSKSRSVTTDQYSDRLLYCYETPTPMFGDIGEGTISDDGLCFIWLDPVFAQTITTDQYQVFLQRYGAGDCYVKERRSGCFIVTGTPGLSFGWEVKAKQRDYDQLRLEKNEDEFTLPAATYGEDAAQHIDQIRKEREAA